MRALYIDKSVLIEGPPGIGKTILVEYIALKLNQKIFKISISEHTDISDLLGMDLPVSNKQTKIASAEIL